MFGQMIEFLNHYVVRRFIIDLVYLRIQHCKKDSHIPMEAIGKIQIKVHTPTQYFTLNQLEFNTFILHLKRIHKFVPMFYYNSNYVKT